MKNLLPFHKAIIEQVSQESGLVVLGQGLGSSLLLSCLIQLYSKPTNLVLVVNTLEQDLGLNKINSTLNISARKDLYLKGGIYEITQRILVVDLLNQHVPISLVSGLLFLNAHLVQESSVESFITNIYRNHNTQGFIYAFTSSPPSSLLSVCKALSLRQVYLWPRFQEQVIQDLKAGTITLSEIRVKMGKSLLKVQQALLDTLDDVIHEIKASYPFLDANEIVLENALFDGFDRKLKSQLEPLWHRVSQKTKQLVQDCYTLRKLIRFLTIYDCVTFYSYLEAVRASALECQWLLLDSAQLLFGLAKERVVQQEELPKWKVLRQILQEIYREKQEDDMVLIMTKEDRSRRELMSILNLSAKAFLHSKLSNLKQLQVNQPVKPVNKRRRAQPKQAVDMGIHIVPEPLPETPSVEWSNLECHTFSKDDSNLSFLLEKSPKWIILYDPDVGFIRNVEVYTSLVPSKINVYFLVYDQSVEEKVYLSNIRREKEAFERLIKERASMAIPLSSPRETELGSVIVDVREFRSSLPHLLYKNAYRVAPVTLEVGDYILSPTICVERKSPSDLVGSLKNGRLFSQCENMLKFYSTCIVLIEFDGSRIMLRLNSLTQDISQNDIISRLALLMLHFPKIYFLWSFSPLQTVSLFQDLKVLEPEPDVQKAIEMGSDDTSQSIYNSSMDILLSFPGVTTKNVHKLLKAKHLLELSNWTRAQFEEALGAADGGVVFTFLNCVQEHG